MESVKYAIENNLNETMILVIGAIVFLLVIVIIQAIKLSKIKNKLSDFTNGKNGISIEEVLLQNKKDIANIKEFQYDISKNIDIINNNLKRTYEKISIYRYDAFDGLTGKLSSVLTMLNKENSGFIINTIYNRDGCYVYVKEVINGKTEQTLSKEEKISLDNSISK